MTISSPLLRHHYLRALYLTLAIVATTLCSCSGGKSNGVEPAIPHEEINELKQAIHNRVGYEHDYLRSIDSIRQRTHSRNNAERFNAFAELSEKFRTTDSDSALVYARICTALAEQGSVEQQQEAKLLTIYALATAGIFTQALNIFNEINPEALSMPLRIKYWIAARTLYSYMRSYVEDQKQYYNTYNTLYLQYDDSLLLHLPSHDPFRKFIECERLVTEGKYDEAKPALEQLLRRFKENTNLYGMTAYQMAIVYRETGQQTLYATYLAKSAKSDVQACVREGIALPMLAEWLYNRGRFSDAFSFINFSLEEAMEGNARMRTVSIAKMVPMIDIAYRERLSSSRDELMAYFILAMVLFFITVALLMILFRSMRKMRINEQKLSRLSKQQESYIGHFIELCATYNDRFDSLSKTVSRKLAAGQAEELLKLVNSGKLADTYSEKFFTTFDAAFLDLYPDFIAKINTLLRPEEQLAIQEGETLTPELRIYAFVRLGIEESTRIAQILHYSVSTVYAYRNRMRNRAIDRPNFDADVQKL